MSSRNPIALAIPLFLAAIGLELVVARRRGRAVYRLQDALADLGCGIGQQVVLVFAAAGVLGVYAWLHGHARVVTFADGSAAPWLLAFVAVDVVYYWWHRLSHEVNLLWAAHAVHHQSEDYNLAVALRQSILTSFTSLPFNLPLAVLGVPPAVYATMAAVSTLYQFWIHTELVGSLGWVERFLNTPSHHRVHHAVNPRYLDRNYGAILIVWDRLFGTFVEESEPAVFGTTKPLRSFNSLWAQLQPWPEIAAKGRVLRGWRDRARLWLAPPSWSPDGAAPAGAAELAARPKHAAPVPAAVRAYALLQFAPAVVGTFLMLLLADTAPRAALLGGAAAILWTLLAVGALMDGARWGVAVELGRLAAVAAVAAGLAARGAAPWLGGAAVATAAGSAAWLLRARTPGIAAGTGPQAAGAGAVAARRP